LLLVVYLRSEATTMRSKRSFMSSMLSGERCEVSLVHCEGSEGMGNLVASARIAMSSLATVMSNCVTLVMLCCCCQFF
jgi:hypothetical protein